MNRITEIQIAGTKYPLNFSVKAAKEVTARYGDISNVTNAFKDKPLPEMLDEANWLLYQLISQGIEYKKIVDDIDIKPIKLEQLEVIMGVADFANMKETIMGAMLAGMDREIEIEVEDKNPNEEAKQE